MLIFSYWHVFTVSSYTVDFAKCTTIGYAAFLWIYAVSGADDARLATYIIANLILSIYRTVTKQGNILVIVYLYSH